VQTAIGVQAYKTLGILIEEQSGRIRVVSFEACGSSVLIKIKTVGLGYVNNVMKIGDVGKVVADFHGL
jgi:hypothetical protein